MSHILPVLVVFSQIGNTINANIPCGIVKLIKSIILRLSGIVNFTFKMTFNLPKLLLMNTFKG